MMELRAVSNALGCEVRAGPIRTATTVSPARREFMAMEHYEDFEERCRCESIATSEQLQDAISAFHQDTNLAKAMIVWRRRHGSSNERLLLIRSCARLGRTEMVLALLRQNVDEEALPEDLLLDAVRGDKAPVVRGLMGSKFFEPPAGFLGYALAECGASRSAGCASCLIDDERVQDQALQQCHHERFGLPPWTYLRVIENAILKAVEAGARDDKQSSPAATCGSHQCLRLLAGFGERRENTILWRLYKRMITKHHLQDNEWKRILRQAIGMGEEGPICAILRADPSLLLQAERLDFCAGSQGAATQRILGFANLFGPSVQDVS